MYQFKKRDFIIHLKSEHNGIIVMITRNKYREQIIFSLINTCHLYKFNVSKWEEIGQSDQKLESSVVELLASINKISINNKYIQLNEKESNILEDVIYDLIHAGMIRSGNQTRGIHTDILPGIHYFNIDKMISHVNGQLSIYPLPSKKSDTPTLMISPPPVSSSEFFPVSVSTKIIQKGKSKTTNHSDFYEMAKRRGKWKMENPNWAEDIRSNLQNAQTNIQTNVRNKTPIIIEEKEETTIDYENNLDENNLDEDEMNNEDTIDYENDLDEDTINNADENQLSLDVQNSLVDSESFIGILTGPEEPII